MPVDAPDDDDDCGHVRPIRPPSCRPDPKRRVDRCVPWLVSCNRHVLEPCEWPLATIAVVGLELPAGPPMGYRVLVEAVVQIVDSC